MSDNFVITSEILDRLRNSETGATANVQLNSALAQPLVPTVYTLNTATELLQYPMEVLRDGARGYWRLGEPLGPTANDASTNARHGTYAGTLLFGVSGALTAAMASDVNTAVTFSAGASLTIPHNALFGFAIGNFTIELWINTTQSTSLPATVVDKTAAGVFPYRLRLVAGGFMEAARSDGSATATLTSSLPVDDGEWHYVLFRRNGSTLSLAIDEEAAQTTADTTTAPNSTADILIADGLMGTLDELAIYGSALTDEQRVRHWSAAQGIEVTA